MEIIQIDETNINLVREFIATNHSPNFRYFKTRTIESVLPNHLFTAVLRDQLTNEIIGYGHLDNDNSNNKIWLGICIIESAQGKGYGKELMNKLVSKAKELNLNRIHLTVDKENYKARLLYQKFNFKEISSTDGIIEMILDFKISNIIELPVSYGEAFDKLTILDIKLQKITDSRRNDVQVEYDAINNKLKPLFTNNILYHYNILKAINLKIWDMQDEFRDSKDMNQKNKLCNEIIIDNDRRFRVKHKINYLLDSHLKEQKGYKKRRAFILNHLGHGDMLTTNGLVRYYSTIFDEVVVPCIKTFIPSMELVYADDPTIKLMPVDSWAAISPERGLPMSEFNKITAGFDEVILTGCNRNPFYGGHMLSTGRGNRAFALPFCFYHDVGVDKTVMWEYFHVAECKKAIQIYNDVYSICKNKYIMIQINTSDTNNIIPINIIENKLKIKKDEFLIIDINNNIYSPEDKYYALAQEFVNLPLIYYSELLKHSYANILSNSSLFCLAMQLDLDTDLNYCIGRSARWNDDLSYIYTSYQINKKIKRFKFNL